MDMIYAHRNRHLTVTYGPILPLCEIIFSIGWRRMIYHATPLALRTRDRPRAVAGGAFSADLMRLRKKKICSGNKGGPL